ncbi:proline-rich receptor-like protein kinase PERK1 [Typha angustifolia]|uniref:proline-rich receptor-like protein kinase PERK1 n=1 Tax=Typha angustifolia TaxID=59011 RepID=UPI003C2E1BC2
MSSPTSSPPPPSNPTAPPPSTPSSPPPPTGAPPPSSPPPPTSDSPPPPSSDSPPPPSSDSPPPPTSDSPPPQPTSPPPPPESASPPAPTTSPPPPALPPSSPPPPPTTSPPPPVSPSPSPPPPVSSPPPPVTPSPSPPPPISSPPPPATPSPSPPPPVSPPPPPAKPPVSSPPPPVTPSPSPPPSPPPPAKPPASSPPPPVTPSPTPPPSLSSPPPPAGSSPPPPAGSSPPPPVNPSTSPPPPHRSSPPPPLDPSTSPPPPPPPSSSSKSVSVPMVVGVTAGSVLVLLALLGAFIFWGKRSRHRRRASSLPRADPYDSRPPYHSSVQIPFSPTPPPASSRPISSSGGSGSYLGSENPQHLQPPAMSTGPYTYEELAAASNGFSDANLLGQGGFGQVYRGTLNGTEVAIKKLSVGSRQGDREFRTEIEVISRVHHRNLVSLVGYCIHGDQRLLVYEFVPNKTLESHLHGSGRPTLDWPRRWKIAAGSAKGLAYLHEDCHPKIIHRDIKAANVLLDFDYEPKVSDFGLAKFQPGDNTHVSTRVVGTFGYLAPEYANSGKLTDRSDVFSFGVMVLELITGKRPVHSSETYMDGTLVGWARPLLTRALEDDHYNELVDPKLGTNYDPYEMARLVACAAAAVRHSAKHRPRMSQIVRYLEGEISLEDLNAGMKPGQSAMQGSGQNASEEVRRLRTMAFGSHEYVSSEQSEPSSEYGQRQSESSSGVDTGEIEVQVLNKHSQGLSS